MTLFFADLVREAGWGGGASDLPLGGALPGHRRFADAVPPGARFHYCIAGVSHPEEWEVGEGEIGSGDTLIRLPLASSAGGEAVPFSPGLKTVALTVAADWFAARDPAPEIADVDGLEAELAAKQPLNAQLTALAGLAGEADKLPYFTGAGTAALTTLSSFGRGLIDDSSAEAALSTLGIGTAWGVFTPTVAASSGVFTAASATGRFKQLGKLVFFQLVITITTAGTATGVLTATLPATAAAAFTFAGRENSVTGSMVQGNVSAASGLLSITRYDSASIIGDGRAIRISGYFEVA
ncbi:MAG: hypothetical protein ACT4N8_07440 [Sphingosinicella sp.]|uniref:hypothetical protein n=1 Tax=Sphingosinicella sp. TaxID=1917971 RepID=UPI0040377465